MSKCKLCNSSNLKEVHEEQQSGRVYHIVYCRDCELYQVMEHYEQLSPTYIDLNDTDINPSRIWCMGEHKRKAFEQWYELVESQLKKTPQNNELLDIGCGIGGFLDFAADKGFNVYGFDLSRAQAMHAAEKHKNVKVASSLNDYLDALGDKDKKFDFITLWDVFEHIRDPLKLLQEIRPHLASDGRLFISVPNGSAIPWKKCLYKLFNKTPALIPWEHVFFHTLKSLEKYLTEQGFVVCKLGAVKIYPRPLSFFEMLRRIFFSIFRFWPKISPQIYVITTNTVSE
jgi:2-polyprenyl-3-methyl-5-hydroxy-6-metoxy-1,4-benzoquinol methylase